MKIKYKLLIDLCNSYEKTLPNTITEYGFITPKSYFVDHIIKTLTKKDKNFPKKEFLKQVGCKYESNDLLDIFYTKKHNRLCRKMSNPIKIKEMSDNYFYQKQRQKIY